jgi:hypothetical protein
LRGIGKLGGRRQRSRCAAVDLGRAGLSFSATLAVKFVPRERRSEKLDRTVRSRRAATPDAPI